MKFFQLIKSRINVYMLFMITLFLLVNFIMEYFSRNVSFESLMLTLPILVAIIYWCKNSSYLIKKNDTQLNFGQIINRDMFLICYSFISFDLSYLLFQYNNIDRAWWSLSLYCVSIYGLVFAVFFAFTAQIIKNHRLYSIIFSWIIFFTMLMSSLRPHQMYIYFIGEVHACSFTIGLLALCHLLICASYFFFMKPSDFK